METFLREEDEPFKDEFCFVFLNFKIKYSLAVVRKSIEQTFGLCGRGRGWDDLGEWH